MKLFHPSKFVKGETASQRPISKFTAASVLTSALGCGSGALTVPLETPKPVYHEEKTAEAKQDAREKVPEAKQVAPAVQPPEEKIDLNAELLGAAKKGETARAAKLIEKGTDVNAKNDDAWTALTHASRKGHAEVAEILVAKGANINAKTRFGQPPLFFAIDMNYPEIADLLRQHGVRE